MKKIIMFLMIILLTGCGNPKYTEISYEQLKEKLDNKDTFVLLLGSDTCSACANYKITMEKVMKDKKIEIFYVNLNLLSEQDYAKIYSKFVVNSTPTTIFIKDGEEISTYERLTKSEDYKTVVEKLEKLGYIGE